MNAVSPNSVLIINVACNTITHYCCCVYKQTPIPCADTQNARASHIVPAPSPIRNFLRVSGAKDRDIFSRAPLFLKGTTHNFGFFNLQ